MRFIDADMIEYFKTFNPNKGEKTIADMAWRSDIDAIPTADVAPVVRGEWIDAETGKCKCSHCKNAYKIKAKFLYSYCPNCGARMDRGR